MLGYVTLNFVLCDFPLRVRMSVARLGEKLSIELLFMAARYFLCYFPLHLPYFLT